MANLSKVMEVEGLIEVEEEAKEVQASLIEPLDLAIWGVQGRNCACTF